MNIISKPEFLNIERFEIVANNDRSKALICFIGRIRVKSLNEFWLGSNVVFVQSDTNLPLRFFGPAGIIPSDIELLQTAKEVWINRTFEDVEDTVQILLKNSKF